MFLQKKRKVLLGLCVVLLVGLLAACGNNNTANNASSGEAPKQTGDTGSVSSQPLSVEIMFPENPTLPAVADSPVIRAIKKLQNVDVKIRAVPEGSYDDKKKTLIATNNIPDVIQVHGDDIQTFARTGIFLNISEYMDHAPHLKKLLESRPEIKKFMVDGNLYGFPILEKYRISVAPQLLIRSDVLADLNLEVPTTWDEYFEVLKKFKEAYPDKIPFTGRNGTKHMIGQMAFPLGSGGFPGFSESGMYFEPNTGKYVYGPASPNFKEVVTFFNKMYVNKLLDPDYATNTKQMFFQKMSSGKGLSDYDNNTQAAKKFLGSLKKINPKAAFVMVPPMENAFGETRSYRYERDWMDNIYAISSKVKDPARVVEFYDWLYSEEGSVVSNFGIEGETFDMVDGKPKFKDSIVEKYKGDNNPIAAIQSATGTGMQNLAVYADESIFARLSDPFILEMAEQIDELTGKSIQYIVSDPPFNKEEAAQLKKIGTQLDTMFVREIDKFIMGTRPLSEYEGFQKELRDKGATQLEKIYNDALARLQ